MRCPKIRGETTKSSPTAQEDRTNRMRRENSLEWRRSVCARNAAFTVRNRLVLKTEVRCDTKSSLIHLILSGRRFGSIRGRDFPHLVPKTDIRAAPFPLGWRSYTRETPQRMSPRH